MLVGHSWADLNGVILQIDEPVADLLRRRRRDIEGKSYLDITHPADRPRNAALVSTLRPGAGPKLIRKRYLAGDGTEVWVALETSRIGIDAASVHLLGTFMVSVPEENPRRLWRQAKRLLDLHDVRESLMGGEIFMDHAWRLLLHMYLAEAEGRASSVIELSFHAKLSASSVGRWVALLAGRCFIRIDERDPNLCELTQAGLDAIERLLVVASPD